MTLWMLMILPAAALAVVLVHDFMAGLSEDRLWSDPLRSEDNRGGGAHVTRAVASIDSASSERAAKSSASAADRHARPA